MSFRGCSTPAHGWLRLGAVTVALILLGFEYWRHPPAFRRVEAARENDPNLIWSIGTVDNASDEFGPGAARDLVYDAGGNARPVNWRQRQDSADEGAPVYRVRF